MVAKKIWVLSVLEIYKSWSNIFEGWHAVVILPSLWQPFQAVTYLWCFGFVPMCWLLPSKTSSVEHFLVLHLESPAALRNAVMNCYLLDTSKRGSFSRNHTRKLIYRNMLKYYLLKFVVFFQWHNFILQVKLQIIIFFLKVLLAILSAGKWTPSYLKKLYGFP